MNEAIDYNKLARAITPLHPEALWDRQDVANYLRRSKSFVEKLVLEPSFPKGIKINGGNHVYRAKDVMKWVETPQGRKRENAV